MILFLRTNQRDLSINDERFGRPLVAEHIIPPGPSSPPQGPVPFPRAFHLALLSVLLRLYQAHLPPSLGHSTLRIKQYPRRTFLRLLLCNPGTRFPPCSFQSPWPPRHHRRLCRRSRPSRRGMSSPRCKPRSGHYSSRSHSRSHTRSCSRASRSSRSPR